MSKVAAEVAEDNGPPAETKVGCCNYLCRWLGGCDLVGSGTPNLREGVLKKRACTDVPWFLALGLFTVILIVLVWTPVAGEGEWERFTGASDFALNTCGTGDWPKYGAWPNPLEYDVKVCVESCDDVYGYDAVEKAFWCIPDSSSDSFETWKANWDDNTIVRMMSDLYTYRDVPILAAGLTFVFIFLFFIFVRYFLRLLMRLLWAGLFVGTAYGGYSFMQHGPDADPEGFYTGVVILCVGGSFWCLIMCCWSQMMTVIKVLEKASNALMTMPHAMLLPFFTMPITFGIILVWYLMVVLMFSASDVTTEASISGSTATLINTYYDSYTDADTANYYVREMDYTIQGSEFWIHLFWMFWAVTFMEYFNFLVISGCVADWYLDKELIDHPDANEEFKKSNCKRLFSAIWRTIRYHLGTVAFASALIAMIKTIEAALMYIKKQIGDDTGNPFAKVILKVCMLVVKCLKCILDRCNKMTLVVTAVCGSPFCAGCGKALGLFFKNLALMSLGTGMIMLMVLMSNICVALLATGTAGYVYLGDNATELNSSFMPLAAGFMASFSIAKVILSAWDCAATTILVCHCMLQEWYPEEFGKNLVKKAQKVKRPGKDDDKAVEVVDNDIAI